MKYTIVIEKLAEKFIVKLPKPDKERVLIDNGKLIICVVDAGNRGDIYKRY